jgi:hypothetical protein
MKRFVKRTGLFCLAVLLVLGILDVFVSYGLRKSNSNTFNNLNKVFNGEINADLVVNGSSKALVHFSPKILDSVMEINSYNLALDGTEFMVQKTQYDIYLKNNTKPKYVIQTVSSGSLVKNTEIRNQVQFAPYLNVDEINEMAKKYDGFKWYDYYVPFVRYTGEFEQIVDGSFSAFNVHLKQSSKYKGYLEKQAEWDSSFANVMEINPNGISWTFDSASIKLFRDFLEESRAKDITVFLVYPPTYHEFHSYLNNRQEILSFYKKIAEEYAIPFMDYSNCFLSQDKSYFYNSQHLNKKGAELFSQQVANDILKYLD